MKLVLRLLLTLICAASAYFFSFWMGGALIYALQGPLWLMFVIGAAAALLVAVFVWKATAALQPGLASSILMGAVITGCVGFACGFFGPLIFMPGANQGPLLGLFLTGPAGFILGAIGGAVHWMTWGRKRAV